MCDARGYNEIIVKNRHVLPVFRIDKDTAPDLIDTDDFTENHRSIALFPYNAPERKGNLPGCQCGGSNLIEERLKHVMIGSINENDSRRRALERLGRCQACQTPPPTITTTWRFPARPAEARAFEWRRDARDAPVPTSKSVICGQPV